MKATEFKPSDYRRIVAIASQAIITAFNERRFSFSSADIEDVSSDTLARVVKNWERYDESISESSWFSTIAYRCACAHMKREGNWRYHHISLEVTTDDGEFYEVRQSDKEAPQGYRADDDIISTQRTAAIKSAIYSLGAEAGEAIWLQANGHSQSEIVEILGTGYGATKTRMSHGRNQLRENRSIRTLCAELFGKDSATAA